LTTDQKNILSNAISAPLVSHLDIHNSRSLHPSLTKSWADAVQVSAYNAFSQYFLSTPKLSDYLGGLQSLAALVNITILAESLLTLSSTLEQSEAQLWLLAHFISLHRLKDGSHQQPAYMKALTVLLSNSASEIVGRIDAHDPEATERAHEDADEEEVYAEPLPQFVKNELVTLVNKESITGLLTKFNR
jgi:ubiquitin-protein ligase E3 C